MATAAPRRAIAPRKRSEVARVFTHGPNSYGWQVLCHEEEYRIGELFYWPVAVEQPDELRVNWIWTQRDKQRLGIGRRMLVELKSQVEHNHPGMRVLRFESVTSMGMARLIETVFGPMTGADVPRQDWANELPEKSPASASGNISRSAPRCTGVIQIRE